MLYACAIAAAFALGSCNIHDEDEDIPPSEVDASDNEDGDEDCVDADNDGWCVPDDCSDQNPLAHPGRVEDCDDGFDNDCNGLADADDAACPGEDDVADDDDDADDDAGAAS